MILVCVAAFAVPSQYPDTTTLYTHPLVQGKQAQMMDWRLLIQQFFLANIFLLSKRVSPGTKILDKVLPNNTFTSVASMFYKTKWSSKSYKPAYNAAVVQICWESHDWYWLAYCPQSSTNKTAAVWAHQLTITLLLCQMAVKKTKQNTSILRVLCKTDIV